jgi:hypothetical protein
MATYTSKALYRGAASTTLTSTLYTVPSATNTVVTEILVANTAASSGTFTVYLNGTIIANTVTVGANDTTVISCKQPIAATQTIQGGASATTINFSITGVEIS